MKEMEYDLSFNNTADSKCRGEVEDTKPAMPHEQILKCQKNLQKYWADYWVQRERTFRLVKPDCGNLASRERCHGTIEVDQI